MPSNTYEPFIFEQTSFRFRSFEDLCDALECLDPEAARYARECGAAKRNPTRIRSCFIWDETPQGYDFWSDLERRLYDIRDKPRCYANGMRIKY